MRKLSILTSFLAIAMNVISCTPPEIVDEKIVGAVQPDEQIILTINEAVEFNFVKNDSIWSGELTFYTLNEHDEKVVQQKLISAQDSSWQDFDLYVDFLDIYHIKPQHEIEGWVPKSDQLPQRVYSFELFDGEKTTSFTFQDPQAELRKYWQSQNVLTFATFVQNELNWREQSGD